MVFLHGADLVGLISGGVALLYLRKVVIWICVRKVRDLRLVSDRRSVVEWSVVVMVRWERSGKSDTGEARNWVVWRQPSWLKMGPYWNQQRSSKEVQGFVGAFVCKLAGSGRKVEEKLVSSSAGVSWLAVCWVVLNSVMGLVKFEVGASGLVELLCGNPKAEWEYLERCRHGKMKMKKPRGRRGACALVVCSLESRS